MGLELVPRVFEVRSPRRDKETGDAPELGLFSVLSDVNSPWRANVAGTPGLQSEQFKYHCHLTPVVQVKALVDQWREGH